jgi:hypothetical protein
MLKSLVSIASLRTTKVILFLLWVSSLASVLEHGWAWERHEALERGELVERYKYFDVESTPVFVWLTMILVGYAAHLFKERSPGYYGLVEILCGLLGGFLAIGKLPLDQTPAWVGLLASSFMIVRGAGNVAQSVAQPSAVGPTPLKLSK